MTDVTAIDNEGNNYLHTIALLPVGSILLFSKEIVAMATVLLEKGVNPNQLNKQGKTPLHIACEKNLVHLACIIASSQCK